MLEKKLWYELYRPTKLEQCFLPEETLKLFKRYLRKKDVPNLLLSGSPGIGKTTSARVLCEQLGAEYIIIPASLKGNIDTLRNEIQQFASTVSFDGGKKYVILDEADRLTPATQAALRGFLDEYSGNCGFIFTCNYRERIEPAISESRLTEVTYLFKQDEKPALAKGVYELLVRIMGAESVSFDPKDLQKFVVESLRRSGDLRRLLVQAQRNSTEGVFHYAVNDSLDGRFDKLSNALKTKNFRDAREWIGENADVAPETIYRYLYNNAKEIVNPTVVGGLILILAKYQYQQAFVADSEINLAACMIELMMECFP